MNANEERDLRLFLEGRADPETTSRILASIEDEKSDSSRFLSAWTESFDPTSQLTALSNHLPQTAIDETDDAVAPAPVEGSKRASKSGHLYYRVGAGIVAACVFVAVGYQLALLNQPENVQAPILADRPNEENANQTEGTTGNNVARSLKSEAFWQSSQSSADVYSGIKNWLSERRLSAIRMPDIEAQARDAIQCCSELIVELQVRTLPFELENREVLLDLCRTWRAGFEDLLRESNQASQHRKAVLLEQWRELEENVSRLAAH